MSMTKARFEYLEMLRPLRKRIVNQRAELKRLQAYRDWYMKYALTGSRDRPAGNDAWPKCLGCGAPIYMDHECVGTGEMKI
jgi:hypothetical protein